MDKWQKALQERLDRPARLDLKRIHKRQIFVQMSTIIAIVLVVVAMKLAVMHDVLVLGQPFKGLPDNLYDLSFGMYTAAVLISMMFNTWRIGLALVAITVTFFTVELTVHDDVIVTTWHIIGLLVVVVINLVIVGIDLVQQKKVRDAHFAAYRA